MLRAIAPIRRPLDDRHVPVPASKSIAARELVLSALANGVSHLDLGPLDPGEDVAAMRGALAALGVAVEGERAGTIVIGGTRGAIAPDHGASIDAADAGTVARFGAALAALASDAVTIDGSERLRERPIGPLVRALRDLGARASAERLPLEITGPLRGGAVTISGAESSQFASALLLVAPAMPDGLRLTVTGPLVSAPFVDLTVSALERRGVEVARPAPSEFSIAPQRVRARNVTISGDVSAATYPAAAAAILGGAVTIEHVNARLEPGEQGDARFFELIQRMGCKVAHGPGGVTVQRGGELYGITADVSDCSDVFPTLAVIAACAQGPTELTGIGHTRRQESDRIAAVTAGLRVLGARPTEYAAALRIDPAPLHGGVVDAAGDHRVAMAFSILGLQVPGVSIQGVETVTKTFPGFYDMLARLASRAA